MDRPIIVVPKNVFDRWAARVGCPVVNSFGFEVRWFAPQCDEWEEMKLAASAAGGDVSIDDKVIEAFYGNWRLLVYRNADETGWCYSATRGNFSFRDSGPFVGPESAIESAKNVIDVLGEGMEWD